MSTQTSFPVFEDSQVLTSSQLNELRVFLDEQNRLTRTKLTGMGAGCGLIVSFDSTTNLIKISSGTGTTSEGYLIVQGSCDIDRFRDYVLPTGTTYEPFMDGAGSQDITLYELMTVGAPADPNQFTVNEALTGSLNFPIGNANFLNDMAVLIFIEPSDILNDSCLGRNCDRFGLDRVYTLRRLMLTQDDLDKVIFRSNGALYDPLFPTKFNLDDVVMRRTLFDPLQAHSQNYVDFSLNYARTFRNDIFTNLFTQLQDTYDVYKPILDQVYNGVNPFLDNNVISLIGTWTNFLNGASIAGGPSYFGIQYFYDFVKELILSYNEFCDTAFELASECCVNMTRFPLHLMIGEVKPNGQSAVSKYRQEFIYSRLQEGQKLILEKALSLHKRMVLQLLSFNFPVVNNPVNVVTRITPSFEKKSVLSARAVPFYYQLANPYSLTSQPNALIDQLQKNWNYDVVRRNRIKNTLSGSVVQIQSHSNQDPNQLVDKDPIATPLYYDLDPYDFFRIEGHFRKSYLDVVTDLENQKSRFDLPFNVIALRLQGKAFDNVEDRCNFEDLRSQYSSLRAEFINMLDDVCERVDTELNPSTFLKRIINDADSISSNMSVEFRSTVPLSMIGTASSEILADPSRSPSSGPSEPDRSMLVVAPVIVPGTHVANRDKPLDTLVKDYQRNITSLCDKLDQLKLLLPFDFKDFKYGDDIANIDQSFILSFIDAVNFAFSCKVSLERLLDFIVHNVQTRFTPELYFLFSQYTTELLTLFNNFVQDGSFKQFENLYFTYLYRVNYLTENDPQLFSNFIKKHPGIEHQAGVKKGGTFIVVYNGDNITVDIKKRDEAILVARNIQTLTCRQAVLQSKPVKSKVEVLEMNSINFQLTQCFNLNAQYVANEVSFVAIQQIQVEEHQVVADFALPYLCCCDCDCGEIPAPKETDLKLPAVLVPSFLQYNMGDFAFGTTITDSMQGCSGTSITPLTITLDEIKRKVQYNPGAGSVFKLKLIQNGAIHGGINPTSLTPNDAVLDSITTTGGSVKIVYHNSTYQFVYTPIFNFVGVDTFDYIFEVYDSNGAIALASTPGKVVIHVHCHCDATLPIGEGTLGDVVLGDDPIISE